MRRRQRIGDVLLDWGVLTNEQLAAALLEQRTGPPNRRLGTILVDRRDLDEVTVAAALADVHHLTVVDLDSVTLDPGVGRALDRTFAEQRLIVPINAVDGVVSVAVSDPVDVLAIDETRTRLRAQVRVFVATRSQILRKISELWDETVSTSVVSTFVEGLDAGPAVEVRSDSERGAVDIVSQIIATAAARRASDIHIEPDARGVRIRIRTDGVMQELLHLPPGSLAPIVSRIKVMAGMEVVQRRAPQDARWRFAEGGLKLDLRVSAMPTLHGESVVLRILPSQEHLPTLATLGLPAAQLDRLAVELGSNQGFVIVTGPTGSGKSTSIYAMLKEHIGGERKTITLEDPVELELDGITQVQIDDAAGATFASSLRAALRQDPDVVVVGEVRDPETAELAISAALTGHLVLTTLHTADALGAVERLVQMGVPRYLVADSVSLVFGQRLLRRPCAFCAVEQPADPATLAALEVPPERGCHFVAGPGCAMCAGTGYLGRIGAFEMLDLTPAVRTGIARADSTAAMAAAGEAGYVPLRNTAAQLAVEGLTTVQEVLRAVGSLSSDPR